MTIEEIMAKMTAIVDQATAEKRSLTAEEVTAYEAHEADLATARKDAELRSRHNAYQTPVAGAPAVIQARDNGDEVLERAFESYLRTGQRNMDLVELRAQETGTPSEGGYLVPPGFRAKLIERMTAEGGFAPHAETITTEGGNPIEWPTINDTANEAEIVAEEATGVAGADLVFGTGTLGAYKYMSLGAGNLPLRVSVELLQDSAFDINALVSRLLGKRIARAMNADFVVGSGSGEPLGILAGTTTEVALATGNPFTYAKLLDLVHSVDPEYRANGKFLFNDVTLKGIRALEDDNGRILWLPASGSLADELPGGTLMGYPVIIDNAAPNAGDDNAFGAFGDFREAYVIRRVRDVQLVVDPYGRAANGQVQYTAWARADGTVQNAAAYAKLMGFDS